MAWGAIQRRKLRSLFRRRDKDEAAQHTQLAENNNEAVDPKLEMGPTKLSHSAWERGPAPQGQGDSPLQVVVSVKFLDVPVRSLYTRTYAGSPSFEATDRICRGLLRRIDHCSQELITRKDSDALNWAYCPNRPPKVLRFEIDFQIYRGGAEAWSHRKFKSYQRDPLTVNAMQEVIRSTHRMIGLFLRRHDEGFKWAEEPAEEHPVNETTEAHPSPAGPLSLCCIPRSRFIESSQSWEFIPGYTLELCFRNRNQSRRQVEWKRPVRLSSRQGTPLNLALGEKLVWQAYKIINDCLDVKKETFDKEHEICEGFDGISDCQHFDEDALNIDLRITNNLGPAWNHLYRSIHSKLRLFRHPDGGDCDDFVRELQARFSRIRDGVDDHISRLNDFDLRIVSLKGHHWHLDAPIRFVLDGSSSLSRRSIGAILDRIQSGIADLLRGNDVAIHLIAYKRGHLILDKALIARQDSSRSNDLAFFGPEEQKDYYVSMLRQRIQEDLDYVCKDTCDIDDIPEELVMKLAERLEATERDSKEDPPSQPVSLQEPSQRPRLPRVFPLVPARYEQARLSADSSTMTHDSAIDVEPSVQVKESQEQLRYNTQNGEADEKVNPPENDPSDYTTNAVARSDFSDVRANEMPAEMAPVAVASEQLTPSSPKCVAVDDLQSSHTASDRPSTRPSTPGLSSDDEEATPNNSILDTPNFLRATSALLEPVLRDVESSTEGEALGPQIEDGHIQLSIPLKMRSLDSLLPGRAYPTPPESDVASVDMEVGELSSEGEDRSDSTEVPRTLINTSGDDESSVDGSRSYAESLAEEPTLGVLFISDDSITESDSVDEPLNRISVVEGGSFHDTHGIVEFQTTECLSEQLAGSEILMTPEHTVSDINLSADDEPKGPIVTEKFEPLPEMLISEAPREVAEESFGAPSPSFPVVDVEAPFSQAENAPEDSLSAGVGEFCEEPAEETYRNIVPSEKQLPGQPDYEMEDMTRSKIDYFEDEDEVEPEAIQGREETEDEESSVPITAGSPTQASVPAPETSENAPIMSDSEAGEQFSLDFGEEAQDQLTESDAASEPTEDLTAVGEDQPSEPESVEPAGDELEHKPAQAGIDQTSLAVEAPSGAVVESTPVPRISVEAGEPSTTPPTLAVSEPVLEPAPSEESETRLLLSETISHSEQVCPPTSHLLLPPRPLPSPRTSVSSDWEDYESIARTSKDSVDSFHDLDDEVLRPTPAEGHFHTPTAGYFGLHESHLVDMGLRGALVGSHRFDRPSTAGTETTIKAAEMQHPSIRLPKSIRIHRRSRSVGFKPAPKASKLPKGKRTASQEVAETDPTTSENSSMSLSKVMTLFAGMAIASHIVNRSS